MKAPAMPPGTLVIPDVLSATSGVLVAGSPATTFGGVSIDSRTVKPGELFVAIAGPRFDGHDFVSEAVLRGAAGAMVQRDVEVQPGFALVRVSDTIHALGGLGHEARLATSIPVVAITGSTGKTTTKEMTAALLATRGPVLKTEGNLNNRFGLPLTLLRLSPEDRVAVLELGMSAPGELRHLSDLARPTIAVITNVAPVHLESFGSVGEIAKAKAEILEGLADGGAAVLNGDDLRLWRIGEHFRGDVVWFGRDRLWDVSAGNWRGTAFGMRFDLRLGGRIVDVALPLPGPHNVLNFLAAAAVAHRLGMDADSIAEAATRLSPAPHRGEVLRLREDVTLLDDSYNSNPAAVEAAVTTLGMAGGRRRVAFLGDMLELGPSGTALHCDTGERIAPGLDVLVGVGPLAAAFLEGARRAGLPDRSLHALPDSAAAAAAAPGIVQQGDAVLVKGSRGVRMERVVEALFSRFGRVGA